MSTVGKTLTAEYILGLLPHMLIPRGYTTDFDTSLSTGVYSCTSDVASRPEGTNIYGLLLVLNSARYGIQIYFPWILGAVQYRLFIPSESNFTDWRKMGT